MDLSKKYLNKRENDHPDLGNFVHWFIRQQDIKKGAVAQQIGVAGNTLNGYFKQPSLQFSILWRISQAINYNMVMDLGQRLKIPFETEAEKALKIQLAEKEALIAKMEVELQVLWKMKQ